MNCSARSTSRLYKICPTVGGKSHQLARIFDEKREGKRVFFEISS